MILLEPFIRQPDHQNSGTPHLVKFPYNVGRTSRLFFGCLKFLYVLIVDITSSFLLSYCRFNKSPSNSESLSCFSTLSAELFSYEIMRLFAWAIIVLIVSFNIAHHLMICIFFSYRIRTSNIELLRIHLFSTTNWSLLFLCPILIS